VIGVQLGQRLVGFFLTLCGVALLAALFIFLVEDFRLVRKRGSYAPSERLPLAPTLFLIGAVPGILLAVVQISTSVARGVDWRFDWRLLLWLVAALVPLVIAALLWPIHRPESFGKIPRVITFLSAAGLIGASRALIVASSG
jgi:hypothetical protein